MSGAVAVATLVDTAARVGEGPVWDAGRHAVHWVDILAGSVHTTDLGTGSTTTIQTPTLVGAVAPRRSGGFVAAVAAGFAAVDPDAGYVLRCPFLPTGIRMNDAKCDAQGRFWAGSCAMDFAAGRGALHVLAEDWTYRTVLDGITQPNGLDWSPDARTFYLVDTAERTVLAFDAAADGALSNRRILLSLPADLGGVPDGMTVDADGVLWIALWGGGRVLRVDPDGRVLGEVPVPVRQPSSCAFVGADLDRLCITSATEGLAEPSATDGSVLVLDGLGARGRSTTGFAG